MLTTDGQETWPTLRCVSNLYPIFCVRDLINMLDVTNSTGHLHLIITQAVAWCWNNKCVADVDSVWPKGLRRQSSGQVQDLRERQRGPRGCWRQRRGKGNWDKMRWDRCGLKQAVTSWTHLRLHSDPNPSRRHSRYIPHYIPHTFRQTLDQNTSQTSSRNGIR